MNIFFFLGQTFFKQSIGIAREIKSQYPDSEFGAIMASRSNLMEEMDKLDDPKFSRYDWLSGLEAKWLNTPLDKERLKYYENKLGTDELRRIIIADRELGVGFVSCGIVENTDLIRMTINNDDARWSYVVGLLDYYFDVFEKERPDATFAYCVAGAVAQALEVVSKNLGIPFIVPIFTRIGDFYIMDDNGKGMLSSVKREFQKTLQKKSLLADQLSEAKQYLDRFCQKPVVPGYSTRILDEIMQANTYSGMLKTMAVDIARWGAVQLGMFGTKGVLRQRNGFDIMKLNFSIFRAVRKTVRNKTQCFSDPDKINGSYIYYGLHVDPEASTMVLAENHTDQVAVIEAISKNMPVGMKLVVKEHIPCIGRRPKGFYERISQMPDVVLLSPFVDNFTLIKNADLVCSITGTLIWEAMMLGVPALIMGDVHFLNIKEGFVHCPEYTKLGEGIKKALQLKPASDETLQTYIATIMRDGIEVSSDDMWFEKFSDPEKRVIAVKAMADKIIEIVNDKATEDKGVIVPIRKVD